MRKAKSPEKERKKEREKTPLRVATTLCLRTPKGSACTPLIPTDSLSGHISVIRLHDTIQNKTRYHSHPTLPKIEVVSRMIH